MRKIFIFTFTVIFLDTAVAQSQEDTAAMIEKIFSRYKPEIPGCQLSISRNGVVIFSKAWGMADMEHGVVLSTHSIIEAGSVSKQFTAASILLLEQQGKLSLEDDVRKYIPELPDYGTPVRLKHMLHHTSGFRDWGSVAWLAGWPRGTKAYRNEDALEIIASQKALNNKPGDEYIYSNSNYNLFAIIVQRVSGKSLAGFTHDNLFVPAGMVHTQWRDDLRRIVPDRAIAYDKTDNGYQADMPNEYVYGNGGLLTTTEDLLKWNAYYLNGKLGSPSLLSKQTAVDHFNNGAVNSYAAALFIQKTNGWDNIEHSGATAGYRSYLEYFPQLQLSIAWLSNSSQFDTAKVNVVREIENLFAKNNNAAVPRENKPVILTNDKWKSFVGWYRNDRWGEGIQIILKEEKLMVDGRGSLLPVKENVFSGGSYRIAFDNPKGFSYIIPGKDTIHYTKVDPAQLTPASINEYLGTYYSEEVKASFNIILKNDTLKLHQYPDNDFILKASYKDGFIMQNAGNLYFERDKNNKLVKMKISVSRARNIEFVKGK